jgi:GntR family transcriptional regulator, transcriptional repressor for pyruvate dehydrogenase complex
VATLVLMEKLDGENSGTLVQQAMAAVTNYIRSARLKAGDGLPGEMQFAEELGVSRAVMREAFGALAALRLIDVGNGRRARVGTFDGAAIAATLGHAVNTAQVTVPQVWDVRRTLERRTAALAAANRTDQEAEEILKHARAMAANRRNFKKMTEHDVALHHTIATASHNVLFAQVVSSFGLLMTEAVPAAWRTRTTDEQRSIILKCHNEIAEAIANRDAAAAERAMEEHFDESVTRLLEAGYDGQWPS